MATDSHKTVNDTAPSSSGSLQALNLGALSLAQFGNAINWLNDPGYTVPNLVPWVELPSNDAVVQAIASDSDAKASVETFVVPVVVGQDAALVLASGADAPASPDPGVSVTDIAAESNTLVPELDRMLEEPQVSVVAQEESIGAQSIQEQTIEVTKRSDEEAKVIAAAKLETEQLEAEKLDAEEQEAARLQAESDNNDRMLKAKKLADEKEAAIHAAKQRDAEERKAALIEAEQAREAQQRAEQIESDRMNAQRIEAKQREVLAEKAKQSESNRTPSNVLPRGVHFDAAIPEVSHSSGVPKQTLSRANGKADYRSLPAGSSPRPSFTGLTHDLRSSGSSAGASSGASEAYLEKLERLILELNMELGRRNDASQPVDPIEQLSQRIIDLNLENMELRQRLQLSESNR